MDVIIALLALAEVGAAYEGRDYMQSSLIGPVMPSNLIVKEFTLVVCVLLRPVLMFLGLSRIYRAHRSITGQIAHSIWVCARPCTPTD